VTAAQAAAATRAAPGPRAAAVLAVASLCACAGRTPAAAELRRPPLDCQTIRDETLRACVDGFRAVGRLDEADEVAFALHSACPYAGAVAWSGCSRGAFERFEGRSPAGRCGDEGDFVESSIQTSCMRPSAELPLAEWNRLVKQCFRWAELGSGAFRASCGARAAGRPRS
jgi:hypothetical protein